MISRIDSKKGRLLVVDLVIKIYIIYIIISYNLNILLLLTSNIKHVNIGEYT